MLLFVVYLPEILCFKIEHNNPAVFLHFSNCILTYSILSLFIAKWSSVVYALDFSVHKTEKKNKDFFKVSVFTLWWQKCSCNYKLKIILKDK